MSDNVMTRTQTQLRGPVQIQTVCAVVDRFSFTNRFMRTNYRSVHFTWDIKNRTTVLLFDMRSDQNRKTISVKFLHLQVLPFTQHNNKCQRALPGNRAQIEKHNIENIKSKRTSESL